jgi:VWFA-related protein
MHSLWRLASAAALLLLVSARTPGQDEPGQSGPNFSTDVKVVNILATVRTKSGQIINDLTKDDFSLSENGRPEAIKYFSRESDLPLTIGLMVDTSMSQARVLESERSASFQFVDQVLREGKDKVFVTQFDMAVLTRQQLTSSRRDLEQTLPFVDTPTKSELQAQRGGGTLLFDAVVQASREIMSGQRNRKAMIILSDGGDNGSDQTLTSAIEAAQRADTLIYSILFSDPSYGGGDKTAMERLAKETGGSFFAVSKKQTIGQIYGIIEQELRSQYNLGFVSDQPVRVSEFRKLQLTANRKDLVVEARDKYWAQR